MSGMPIPETKKQLETQLEQFKDGKKDAIYVSEGMEFSKDMLKEAGITDADSITVPGIGTFITNNPEKFSKLLTAQAENNLLNNAFLADFLGYSKKFLNIAHQIYFLLFQSLILLAKCF